MDARTLNSKMGYRGMEVAARKLLLKEKLATPEETALMTSEEVCAKLLEEYEVVSVETENITLVKRSDMETYNSIVEDLSR